jgi:CAAX protease family protein
VRQLVRVGPADVVSDRRLLGTVGIELLMAAVWIPVLRRRGWRLEAVTRPFAAADLARGGAWWMLAILSYWAAYSIAASFAAPFARAAHALRVSGSASWGPVLLLCLVNPLAEELIYLGLIANGLRRHGAAVAVSASVLARVTIHVYQGPLGVIANLPLGLLFAALYLDTRRLWPAVIAHALLDLFALSRFVGPG